MRNRLHMGWQEHRMRLLCLLWWKERATQWSRKMDRESTVALLQTGKDPLHPVAAKFSLGKFPGIAMKMSLSRSLKNWEQSMNWDWWWILVVRTEAIVSCNSPTEMMPKEPWKRWTTSRSERGDFWACASAWITADFSWVVSQRISNGRKSWKKWKKSLKGLPMSSSTRVPLTRPRTEDLLLSSMTVIEPRRWPEENWFQEGSSSGDIKSLLIGLNQNKKLTRMSCARQVESLGITVNVLIPERENYFCDPGVTFSRLQFLVRRRVSQAFEVGTTCHRHPLIGLEKSSVYSSRKRVFILTWPCEPDSTDRDLQGV